ncbi:Major facilitator super domain-containing protein 7 [Phytophthora pseudosyringae]|uniref:Major facilitator super domain-containing protein 7 n=1 Tax=Phytophthora pseudosyringae TaxID=221518 RepID=A0A8T1VHM2_9STRA|nr:Major facilitator super domain-containing protein 7 [Phytophthora pseudosyringae]
MLALQDTASERKMSTVIYEDMENGDYGTFLGQKDRLKTPTTTPRDAYRKWFMLALLSVLTAINQGICYSYAPIASIVEKRWEERVHSTELITVYFISYIPCSFVGSWIMDKKGLRYGVLLGGFLQALGAGLRYFACVFNPAGEAYVTLLGQILASIAMPFMVNSPAVFSANWFPPQMRATSTSVAVNANAMGTAFVYLSAPFIVLTSDHVPFWNLYVALFATGAWIVAFFFFQSFPRTGVAQSIVSDVQLRDEYDWGQWATAFTHTGFWHTVVAFSVAECILNAMCALLGKFLSVAHFSKAQIGIVGAVFILSSLVGGQVISPYVDRKRNHKTALQLCLLLTSVAIASFRLVPKVNVHATLVSLMFLGAVLGPLQPIVLELGVECAYPTSEATVAALQQLCGNFLSAILVPGMSALRRTHVDTTGHVPPKYFYASPEWIMVFMTTATFIVFCFFNGTYKRFAHEVAKRSRFRSNKDPILITRTSRGTGSFF